MRDIDYYPDYISSGVLRLSKYFKKKLDDDQKCEILEKLTDRCQDMNAFKTTIDNLIEASRFFPTIREMLNAYRETRNGMIKNGAIKFTTKGNCKLCGGFGVVTVVKANNEFAYACKCEAGSDQSLPQYVNHPLKYEEEFELSGREQEVYEWLKTRGSTKRAVEVIAERAAT